MCRENKYLSPTTGLRKKTESAAEISLTWNSQQSNSLSTDIQTQSDPKYFKLHSNFDLTCSTGTFKKKKAFWFYTESECEWEPLSEYGLIKIWGTEYISREITQSTFILHSNIWHLKRTSICKTRTGKDSWSHTFKWQDPHTVNNYKNTPLKVSIETGVHCMPGSESKITIEIQCKLTVSYKWVSFSSSSILD